MDNKVVVHFDGLKLRVFGGELMQMFTDMAKRAMAKADKTAAKMAVLEKAGEDYKEVAGYSNSSGSSRLEELKDTKKALELAARRCEFIAGHLIADAVYTLDASDLPGPARFVHGQDVDVDFFGE